MTPDQIKVAQTVGLALLDTIAEQGSLGAPSGPMYAALMHKGCTLTQYNSIIGGLLRNQLVTADLDETETPVLLHITERGEEFRAKLAKVLA